MYTRLHGATTQKTAIFILAAVRTSNLAKFTDVLKVLIALDDGSSKHLRTTQHPRRHLSSYSRP
jgi:hypothetical protein